MKRLWVPVCKFLAMYAYPRIRPRSSWYQTLQHSTARVFDFIFSITEYLPKAELAKIQEKRLRRLIKALKGGQLFYRKYLEDVISLDDFHALYPITKERMRQESERGTIVNTNLSAFKIPQHTSGSTGVPLSFFLDCHMLPRRLAMYYRLLRWVGKQKGDVTVRLIPGEHPGLEPEGLFFPCLNPEDIERKKEKIYSIFAENSIVLQSRTSHLIRLAQLMEQDGRRFDFRAIISYTEPLYVGVRKYLEKVFGAPVFNYYASNEITAIGQECEMHQGFHINVEWVVVGVIDENSQPVSNGTVGDVVVTSLDNYVHPFLKYKIGDKGYWAEGDCRCGRTLPRLFIEGRELYSFLLPDGRVGDFFSLIKPIALHVDKILQYQVVRRSPHHFAVKLVPTAKFGENEERLNLDWFKNQLGPEITVDLETVSYIEPLASGKQKAFINLVPDYGAR